MCITQQKQCRYEPRPRAWAEVMKTACWPAAIIRCSHLGCRLIAQILKCGINMYARAYAIWDRVPSKRDDNPAVLSVGEFPIFGKNLSSQKHFWCSALPDLCSASPQLSLNSAYGATYTNCHRAMAFPPTPIHFRDCMVLDTREPSFFISVPGVTTVGPDTQ